MVSPHLSLSVACKQTPRFNKEKTEGNLIGKHEGQGNLIGKHEGQGNLIGKNEGQGNLIGKPEAGGNEVAKFPAGQEVNGSQTNTVIVYLLFSYISTYQVGRIQK